MALGILVGLLGALLGIGGGMVIVPLLVFAWDYEAAAGYRYFGADGIDECCFGGPGGISGRRRFA